MVRPVWLMLGATFFLSLAQLFHKLASNFFVLPNILWNPYLIAGLVCGGLGAILVTIALRQGELSKIYPLISLSFIWTALIGVFVFAEPLSFTAMIGLCSIIAGVSVLSSEGVA